MRLQTICQKFEDSRLSQCLVNAQTVEVKLVQKHFSGNATNQELRLHFQIRTCDNSEVNYRTPVNRARATLGFIFTGGLLIFVSPYLICEAAAKRLPWSVPIIAIPIYALVSYGAFKVYWPRIKR